MSVRAGLRAFRISPFSLPLLRLAPVLCLPFLTEDILTSVFDGQPLVFPLGVQQALARSWVFPGAFLLEVDQPSSGRLAALVLPTGVRGQDLIAQPTAGPLVGLRF